jgi:hypothetical protein
MNVLRIETTFDFVKTVPTLSHASILATFLPIVFYIEGRFEFICRVRRKHLHTFQAMLERENTQIKRGREEKEMEGETKKRR